MPLIRECSLRENIHIFDSDLGSTYEEHLLEDQERLESQHFWFKNRREKICRLFEKKIEKNQTILEIGGGTGFIASQINKMGYPISMGDIYFNGLKYAQKKGIDKLYQFDLFNPPFREEFDVVSLFDVLEHQKDDVHAMECLKMILKPRGKILLTVPAHQWLWNQDDRVNGHFRRYTKKMLIDLCYRSSLEVLHVEYFFTFIVPFLYLRSILHPDRNTKDENEKLSMQLFPRAINGFFHALTKWEFSISRFLPNAVGGSLLLLAAKKNV